MKNSASNPSKIENNQIIESNCSHDTENNMPGGCFIPAIKVIKLIEKYGWNNADFQTHSILDIRSRLAALDLLGYIGYDYKSELPDKDDMLQLMDMADNAHATQWLLIFSSEAKQDMGWNGYEGVTLKSRSTMDEITIFAII